MNGVERLLGWVDRVQQGSRWLGFPLAVMGKFRDDHGGALTTVIVYDACSRTRQLSNHTGRDPAARQVKELVRPADPARISVRYKSTAIGRPPMSHSDRDRPSWSRRRRW